MQQYAAMPRLAITRQLPEPVLARAAHHFAVTVNPHESPYSRPELLSTLADQDAALITLTERFDQALIAQLDPKLRIVATFSVGIDHIDLDAAHARGLAVTNTPDVLTDATAEIAILLTLGACRRAAEGLRMVRDNSWSGWSPIAFLGSNLKDKRVGILGFGRIGQAIAQRLRPFGVDLHYHSRRPVDAPDMPPVHYHDTFSGLCAASDILIIAAASTPETRHIVNRETLSALTPGAILVNVARGDLVDEDAVFEALETGRLSAVGADVFKNEPTIDPRWRQIDRAFLLPHLGSATLETRIAMGMRALDNLIDFFAGRTPRDLVRG
jgi:lactate dehydrogenase-like 2-hydroxyacid dehydrogenase